ncbi:PREDICTED: uncharacterized protein LOC104593692 [Nelumbo nucifera]|uniref:Uncharacterized protein LOC104593692 n=1 Tax=Nelumbo nucifera TaxID=4432 RepID=A0A1U8Q3K7_NELNU|nr:PREDICTED: uncharacterized protein LOC104593692 [Nelumbo nucifera]
MELFPEPLRRLWNKWELRTLVLLSLSIQILLIRFGSSRKRTVAKFVAVSLWLAYLMADWTATLALGVLANSQGDDCDGNSSKDHPSDLNRALVAFWAPFLLLHLGGPDAITAFSLEDNELWLRHLLGLLFQAIVAGYVFIRSFPDKKVWIPAIPMFIAGIIKYVERTWSLMLASRENFRESMVTEPDPGPNYAKFMEEFTSKKNAGLNAEIIWEREPDIQLLNFQDDNSHGNGNKKDVEVDVELLSDAYRFFNTFKRLIVDLILTFHDRNESQSYFLKQTWSRAYKVIEVELGYVYDVLYTKAAVIHTLLGCILRMFSLSSILSAFFIFSFMEKHWFSKIDIAITYVLLVGAIALEIWSLIRLLLSDWTIVWMKQHSKSLSDFLLNASSIYRKPDRSRWSNSMAQYNLINYSLREEKHPILKTILKFIKIEDMVDKYWYRTYTEVTDGLKRFIFDDLNRKLHSISSTSYKHFNTCRGESALEEVNQLPNYDRVFAKELNRSIEVEFDESILRWHIATDICFYLDEESRNSHEETNSPSAKIIGNKKKMCREVSNYMLYLLISRPFMLTAGIGQIKFGDTC